jgi:hypothetical protein
VGKGGRSKLTGRVHRGDGSKLRSNASKNAAFFSSGIDLAPATPVQSATIGYVGERIKNAREKGGQKESPCCVLWEDETRAVSHEKTRQESTPRHAKTSLEGIQKQNHVAKSHEKRYKRYEKICSRGQKI